MIPHCGPGVKLNLSIQLAERIVETDGLILDERGVDEED
jgi:hypothetical protein